MFKKLKNKSTFLLNSVKKLLETQSLVVNLEWKRIRGVQTFIFIEQEVDMSGG